MIRSIIQVYTGDGKGKTTAAWGLAMRAIGSGLRVAVVQFMKPPTSGERTAAVSHFPEMLVIGETSPYDVCSDQADSATCRDESRKIFDQTRGIVLSGDYDVVVLDEINIVLKYGYVTQSETLDLLDNRPVHTELVLTGRYAPQWLIDRADLVTEMGSIKHPGDSGFPARKGIEY
jgi:cob(I)alamin adenosyltransferase